jgi:hypothetical protein
MTGTTAPPRPLERDRWARVRTPLLTIGGLSAATLALHVRDPHERYSWGLCPSAALGLDCPGCGGLRAVNDLTHGEVGAALSSNLLVTVLVPVAAVLLGLWAVDRWRGRGPRWEGRPWLRPAAVVFLAVVALFTVARNLAFGAWLAP